MVEESAVGHSGGSKRICHEQRYVTGVLMSAYGIDDRHVEDLVGAVLARDIIPALTLVIGDKHQGIARLIAGGSLHGAHELPEPAVGGRLTPGTVIVEIRGHPA